MNKLFSIRQLYKPLQPTIKRADANLAYTEVLPTPQLQHIIYYYWQFKTKAPLAEPYKHLIVADGCIDIYFDLNNSRESYVMGFCNSYTEFLLEKTFNYVGIRFLPAMFSQLFKTDAKQLSNKSEPLGNVVPSIAGFIRDHFSPASEMQEIKNQLDAYFLKTISGPDLRLDNRLYESINIILQKSGAVDIENDLNTGISPRQLRRLFEFYIGGTAKSFSNVIRFQNILHTNPSLESLKQNKIFFDLGYYDQAHFIKDFRNFYGLTPGRAFEK